MQFGEQEQEVASNMMLYIKASVDNLLATIHHLRNENQALKKENLAFKLVNGTLTEECRNVKTQLMALSSATMQHLQPEQIQQLQQQQQLAQQQQHYHQMMQQHQASGGVLHQQHNVGQLGQETQMAAQTLRQMNGSGNGNWQQESDDEDDDDDDEDREGKHESKMADDK